MRLTWQSNIPSPALTPQSRQSMGASSGSDPARSRSGSALRGRGGSGPRGRGGKPGPGRLNQPQDESRDKGPAAMKRKRFTPDSRSSSDRTPPDNGEGPSSRAKGSMAKSKTSKGKEKQLGSSDDSSHQGAKRRKFNRPASSNSGDSTDSTGSIVPLADDENEDPSFGSKGKGKAKATPTKKGRKRKKRPQ